MRSFFVLTLLVAFCNSQNPTCGTNEVFVARGKPLTCQPSCAKIDNFVNCSAPLSPNCECKPGFYRNDVNLCVEVSNCKVCGTNETFKCACWDGKNTTQSPSCSKCTHNCYCKTGYYRNSAGKCVTDTQDHPHPTYGLNDPYGPSKWGKISATCDGKRQSPININTMLARKVLSYKSVVIRGIRKVPTSIEAFNNGHSVGIRFRYADGKPATITGGPLKVPYIVDNIHWHWGEDDRKGSEHTINGVQLSAEGHIVSYNPKYGSVAEAKKHADGLAVLGIFYKLTNSKTNNPFINLVQYAIEPNSQYNQTDSLFTIQDVVKTNRFNIYSYEGSLTHPNCNEAVTWLVSVDAIPINSKDLNEFRKVLDSDRNPLKKNFRPVQPLNSRQITLN